MAAEKQLENSIRGTSVARAPNRRVGRVRTLVRAGLITAIPILLFCAVVAPQLHSRERLHQALNIRLTAAPPDTETPAAFDPSTPGLRDQSDDSQDVDLYGNDVTDAVARYKFDATGALYELHSPQTEVPRLRSPKS
jgi:hypothetical protein